MGRTRSGVFEEVLGVDAKGGIGGGDGVVRSVRADARLEDVNVARGTRLAGRTLGSGGGRKGEGANEEGARREEHCDEGGEFEETGSEWIA